MFDTEKESSKFENLKNKMMEVFGAKAEEIEMVDNYQSLDMDQKAQTNNVDLSKNLSLLDETAILEEVKDIKCEIKEELKKWKKIKKVAEYIENAYLGKTKFDEARINYLMKSLRIYEFQEMQENTNNSSILEEVIYIKYELKDKIEKLEELREIAKKVKNNFSDDFGLLNDEELRKAMDSLRKYKLKKQTNDILPSSSSVLEEVIYLKFEIEKEIENLSDLKDDAEYIEEPYLYEQEFDEKEIEEIMSHLREYMLKKKSKNSNLSNDFSVLEEVKNIKYEITEELKQLKKLKEIAKYIEYVYLGKAKFDEKEINQLMILLRKYDNQNSITLGVVESNTEEQERMEINEVSSQSFETVLEQSTISQEQPKQKSYGLENGYLSSLNNNRNR